MDKKTSKKDIIKQLESIKREFGIITANMSIELAEKLTFFSQAPLSGFHPYRRLSRSR
jgi:hypothetical protein